MVGSHALLVTGVPTSCFTAAEKNYFLRYPMKPSYLHDAAILTIRLHPKIQVAHSCLGEPAPPVASLGRGCIHPALMVLHLSYHSL